MSVKRLTKEEKLRIAYDFYKSILSSSAIGKKHNVSPNTVNMIANQYEPAVAQKEYLHSKANALVFDNKDYQLAIKILREFNVPFIIPSKFEMQAEFESKINFE